MNRKLLVLILIAAFCSLLYTLMCGNHLINFKGQKVINPSNDLSNGESKKRTVKQILQWNQFRKNGPTVSEKFDFLTKCNRSDCERTYDRDSLMQSDAVLFVWRNTTPYDLPNFHKPRQVWVMYNHEPPTHFQMDDRFLDNKINWIMSYRHDADVISNYGEFTLIASDRKRAPLNGSAAFTRLDNNKTIGLVSWLVSNCNANSKREIYVRELSKYIPVDIYGRCGDLKCPPVMRREECMEYVYDNYKFYLSFESSFCTDYVTEKFFGSLKYGLSVPVVYGAADYCRLAPPHSYIHTNDFASPRHLAEYLIMLDQNDELYKRYHEWRAQYEVRLVHPLCRLCAKLHSTTADEILSTYESVSRWYFRKEDCLTPSWAFFGSKNNFNITENVGGIPKCWRSGDVSSISNQKCD